MLFVQCIYSRKCIQFEFFLVKEQRILEPIFFDYTLFEFSVSLGKYGGGAPLRSVKSNNTHVYRARTLMCVYDRDIAHFYSAWRGIEWQNN